MRGYGRGIPRHGARSFGFEGFTLSRPNGFRGGVPPEPSDVLAKCLDSLLEMETRPHEIIVVDNCSSDDSTRTLCDRYPVRYVLETTKPGVSRARNRGVIKATGDLVAPPDDDCVVDVHWLDHLGRGLRGPARHGGRRVRWSGGAGDAGAIPLRACTGVSRGAERRVFNGAWDDPVPSAGPAGASANAVFRRSVFSEVGLFAEESGRGRRLDLVKTRTRIYRIFARWLQDRLRSHTDRVAPAMVETTSGFGLCCSIARSHRSPSRPGVVPRIESGVPSASSSGRGFIAFRHMCGKRFGESRTGSRSDARWQNCTERLPALGVCDDR